jgi:hypothetical protein
VRLGTTSVTTTATTTAPRTPPAVTDFLDAIARDVRSGFSLASSFVQCSDQQSDDNHWSQPVAQQCLRGVVLADALVECALPTWTPEIRFASRTLAVASAGGAGVAPALEHSASVLREQHALREREDFAVRLVDGNALAIGLNVHDANDEPLRIALGRRNGVALRDRNARGRERRGAVPHAPLS